MVTETFTVGLDHVVVSDVGVLVHSREFKEDTWQVRKFRRTKIVFREKEYFIAEVRDGGDSWDLIYVLKPWIEVPKDIPGAVIHYNEEYEEALRARDAHARKVEIPVYGTLLLMAPITGLAWESHKLRVEKATGAPMLRITRISTYPETFLGLFFGTVGAIGGSVSIILVGAVLLIDSIMRRLHTNYSEPRRFGFLEWLFKPGL